MSARLASAGPWSSGNPELGHVAVRSRHELRQLEEALAPRDEEVVGVVHVHVDDRGRLAGADHFPATRCTSRPEGHGVEVVDLQG